MTKMKEISSVQTLFNTARRAALLVSLLISLVQVRGQTQAGMNAVARADFVKADLDLNKTYQAVLGKLPIAEKQKLKQAQRAWIAVRDSEAARAADQRGGGSMAPTIRYERMTELTRQRIKELKAMLANAASGEGSVSTPEPSVSSAPIASPAPPKESEGEQTKSASETPGPAAESSATSLSPDKQWEYKCAEYGLGQCAPEIVKAGTAEVVLDLDEEVQVHGPEAGQAKVVWAPDSKRFAFNYSSLHAHHTTYETVAFYQLHGDKWVALRSAADDTSDRSQLLQLAKEHLPKSFGPRHCAPDFDVLKVRNWTDANTAILYAPCYGRRSEELEAAFLFTLHFDDAGNWKIIKTHQLLKKELQEEQ
jgi:uncharacterized protein YecT (DUF1311 family)